MAKKRRTKKRMKRQRRWIVGIVAFFIMITVGPAFSAVWIALAGNEQVFRTVFIFTGVFSTLLYIHKRAGRMTVVTTRSSNKVIVRRAGTKRTTEVTLTGVKVPRNSAQAKANGTALKKTLPPGTKVFVILTNRSKIRRGLRSTKVSRSGRVYKGLVPVNRVLANPWSREISRMMG